MTDGAAKSASKKRYAWIGLVVAAVVLVAAYVAVAAWKSDKVPDGTTVGDTAVGGLSKDAAQAKVDAALKATTDKTVTLAVAGHDLKLQPGKAGLSQSADGALDDLTGFSLKPSTVWQHLTGGGPHKAVTTSVDRAKLKAAIAAAGADIKGAPKNGTVKFIEGKVVTTKSTSGKGVDTAAAATQIAAGWPGKTQYTGRMAEQSAPLTDAEIARFVKEYADPAMAGPMKIAVGSKTVSVAADRVSDLLSTTFNGKQLVATVDSAGLKTLIAKETSDMVTEPVNAKLVYKDGKKTTVAGKKGTEIDLTDVDKKMLAALPTSKRTLTLKTKSAQPKITEADLKDIKVGNQLMSKFVSEFPTGAANAARTKNIKLGLSKLNGIVVQPGETFSLLQVLRPFTAANGYVNAPVLSGGVDVPGMGGGISQVSTTLYNATFFAGLKLVEHKAHTYWIPRYPMGREATMADPTVDNKWTNDSGHPIRIQARIVGNASVIWLYGTKTFTVTSKTSAKFDVTSPGPTQYSTSSSCIAQGAEDGFKVTVTRVVKNLSGKVVKDESLTTTYQPAVRVICGAAPSTSASPSASSSASSSSSSSSD